MIDPSIYRESADECLAPNAQVTARGYRQKGMCIALAQAHGLRSNSAGTVPDFETTQAHITLLEQYFRPEKASSYWWRYLNEETQAERFMCLHFMALIAEDLQ